MKNTLITAHSGCEGIVQDRIDSVVCGIELGADCVEVDVRMDENGILRLSHNKRDNYDAADTLEEAFRMIADNEIAVNCDIKEARLLYPVIALAKKCGLPKRKLIFSGSVSPDLLADDPDIVKDSRIFLNIEHVCKYLLCDKAKDYRRLLSDPHNYMNDNYPAFMSENIPQIVEFAKQVGAECLNLNYKWLTKDELQQITGLGMPISLWTINDEEAQAEFIKLDLLNMTTRSVKTALKVRSEL